jgi:diacylglycerol kinase
MMLFVLARARSFRHAIDGGRYVIRMEPNAKIHAVAALAVVLLGAWLGIEARDWAVLILAIGGVVATEAMNTAVERVVDLAQPAQHPLAKVSKDVAAAAVLASAMAAAAIGLLIIGPPLWQHVHALMR